jgi:hypothetical protein
MILLSYFEDMHVRAAENFPGIILEPETKEDMPS